MRVCIICKDHFENLVKHHISYEFNAKVEVCRKCHWKIHKTKEYLWLRPIDKKPVKIVDINGVVKSKYPNNAQDASDMIGNDGIFCICKRCSYKWTYVGKKTINKYPKYIICPQCRTSVKLVKNNGLGNNK